LPRLIPLVLHLGHDKYAPFDIAITTFACVFLINFAIESSIGRAVPSIERAPSGKMPKTPLRLVTFSIDLTAAGSARNCVFGIDPTLQRRYREILTLKYKNAVRKFIFIG